MITKLGCWIREESETRASLLLRDTRLCRKLVPAVKSIVCEPDKLTEIGKERYVVKILGHVPSIDFDKRPSIRYRPGL